MQEYRGSPLAQWSATGFVPRTKNVRAIQHRRASKTHANHTGGAKGRLADVLKLRWQHLVPTHNKYIKG
jgi:hypothetical protein